MIHNSGITPPHKFAFECSIDAMNNKITHADFDFIFDFLSNIFSVKL